MRRQNGRTVSLPLLTQRVARRGSRYADPEVMALIDYYSKITVEHFKDSPSRDCL